MSTDATRAAFLRAGGPGRFDIDTANGLLLVAVDDCTCNGGVEFGHESHCGWEVVMPLEDFRALPAEEMAQLLRTASRQLTDTTEDRMAQALLFCDEFHSLADGQAGLVHEQELSQVLDLLRQRELERLMAMAQTLAYEAGLHLGHHGGSGIRRFAFERRFQIVGLGYTPQHDDQHVNGELARAANCYVSVARLAAKGRDVTAIEPPSAWPLGFTWRPAASAKENLIKAAALLAAEFDRLERIEQAEQAASDG